MLEDDLGKGESETIILAKEMEADVGAEDHPLADALLTRRLPEFLAQERQPSIIMGTWQKSITARIPVLINLDISPQRDSHPLVSVQ